MRKPRAQKSLRERFYSKFIVDDVSGCWLWTGAKFRKGYGAIGRGKDAEGNLRANRASWILHVGEIPDGLQVLHKCDNPPCVNPAHLFLGTNLENRLDMVNKGRGCKGERHHCSKLTEDDVFEIRNFYRQLPRVPVSKLFGVSRQAIDFVLSKKNWKHAT
jgi:Autographiviridae endonuclease